MPAFLHSPPAVTFPFPPKGIIGNSDFYQPLVSNANVNGYATGPGPIPNSNEPLAPHLRITATGDSHPGSSKTQNSQWDTYVIAAYTVSVPGLYSLHDTHFDTRGPDGDGSDLRVYVNNDIKLHEVVAPYQSITNGPVKTIYNFDTVLGYLSAGDVVYVAVGPRSADKYDGFQMRYTISVGA